MDASFLNQVANSDSVRPYIGGVGVIDLTKKLANSANVALQNTEGGFLFEKIDVGLYELHTLFLPLGRGAALLDAAEEAAHYMFTRTDALELITKVPVKNRRADFMVRQCGFRKLYTGAGAWHDGSDVHFFGMDLNAWREGDPQVLLAGYAFHAVLTAAKDQVASVLSAHPDDMTHDRVVGAALHMIEYGQVRKGVWSYNRWAAVAGYKPIALLSEAPVVVDVVDAIVGIKDGDMEVLLCR